MLELFLDLRLLLLHSFELFLRLKQLKLKFGTFKLRLDDALYLARVHVFQKTLHRTLLGLGQQQLVLHLFGVGSRVVKRLLLHGGVLLWTRGNRRPAANCCVRPKRDAACSRKGALCGWRCLLGHHAREQDWRAPADQHKDRRHPPLLHC